MWPFTRGPLIEGETAGWHPDAFAWLVASFAERRDFTDSRLVLPAPGFFTFDHETGHGPGGAAVRQVEAYGALPGAPLVLAPRDFVPDDTDAPRWAASSASASHPSPAPYGDR